MFATRLSAAGVRKLLKSKWLVGAALLAGAMTLAGAAQASPLAAAMSAGVAFESDVLQVRDNCGRGMRFSRRRDRCVPIEREFDGDRGYDRERDYDSGRRSRRRDDGDNSGAAGAVAAGVVLGIIGATAIRSNKRNKSGTVQNGQTQSFNGQGTGRRKKN